MLAPQFQKAAKSKLVHTDNRSTHMGQFRAIPLKGIGILMRFKMKSLIQPCWALWVTLWKPMRNLGEIGGGWTIFGTAPSSSISQSPECMCPESTVWLNFGIYPKIFSGDPKYAFRSAA